MTHDPSELSDPSDAGPGSHGPDAEHAAAVSAMRRRLLRVGVPLVIGMLVISGLALLDLGGGELPALGDLDGAASRAGSPVVALFVLPGAAVLILGALVSQGGRRNLGVERTPDEIIGVGVIGSAGLALLGVLHLVLIADLVGLLGDPGPAILAVVAVFLAAIGAVMRSGRYGSAGVNLPLPGAPERRTAVARFIGGGLTWVGLAAGVAAIAAFLPDLAEAGMAIGFAIIVLGSLTVVVAGTVLAGRLRD